MPERKSEKELIGGDAASQGLENHLSPMELRLHLSDIIGTSDDAILSKDLNGIILSWNKSAERIFGYTPEEVVGRPAAILMPPNEENEESSILTRIRAGDRIEHYETVRQRKDGSLVDISLSVSPLKDDAGKIVAAAMIAREVSDRKKADRVQRHFTAIVESSDDAILSKNLNSIILTWNKGAERIFGYTAEEIVGKPVTTLIPRGMTNEEPGILARIRKGKAIDHYETVRLRKDGTLIDVSLSVSPIKDEDGNVVGAAKIVRDITERKRAEEALAKAREELARLNETLAQRVEERTASLNEALDQMREFSYSVSHDLRGPVRAMQGYAAAILEDHAATLDPQVAEYVQRILRGSARMGLLIRDVLVYSRLAQEQIAAKPVCLEALVRDIIEHYPEMQSPGAEIKIHSPLLNVLGNESLLTQVVTNLLSNAKKFMAPGVASKIEICTERRGGMVRICFKDNGIGIDPKYHARLFGMFERVHDEAKYEGTGIGLAIVRKAVEKMQGTVGLDSSGTGGSSFWFELPAAEL